MMKIKPASLESLHEYHWLWERRYAGQPKKPEICQLCHDALADHTFEDGYCAECRKGQNEL